VACPYRIERTRRQKTNQKRRLIIDAASDPVYLDIRRLARTYDTQELNPLVSAKHGWQVSPDGTTAVVHDISSNVYQRVDFGIAGDITTVSIGDSIAEDNAGTIWSFHFNSDGTMAWASTSAGTYVWELSVPYDITSKSLIENDVIGNYNICYFSDDGLVMGIIYYLSGNAIYMYNLSAPFDISTRVSYDSQIPPPYGSMGGPVRFEFNADGTEMYVHGSRQSWYAKLATAYTPSSYTEHGEVDYVIGAPLTDTSYQALDLLNSGGISLFTSTGADLYHYSLPTENGAIDEWSTTEVDSKTNFSTSTYSGCWSNDGNYFYFHKGLANTIARQTASTPFDASTLGADDHSVAEPASTSTSLGMFITPDGKTLYVASATAVSYCTLGTAWDLTTAGAWSSTARGTAGGFVWAKHGGAYYVCSAGGGTQTITQWDCTTSTWSIPNAAAGATLDISGTISTAGQPDSIDLSPDGTKIYALAGSGVIHYWTMSTPYDLSTATYGGTQTFRTLSAPQSMYVDQWNNDGDFYCWDGTNNDLYHYTRAGG